MKEKYLVIEWKRWKTIPADEDPYMAVAECISNKIARVLKFVFFSGRVDNDSYEFEICEWTNNPSAVNLSSFMSKEELFEKYHYLFFD